MSPEPPRCHRPSRHVTPSSLCVCLLGLALLRCGGDEAPSLSGDEACGPGEVQLSSGACQRPGLPPDKSCAPGELTLPDGGCRPAGLPPDLPCSPGELSLPDGSCRPAGLPPDLVGGPGVPPEACGVGFVSDGRGGCEAVLPEQPCPPGQMAVPGETACHEVSPCGDGKYGDIPVDPTTRFVDASYPGNDSDGSMERPFRTLQGAADAAAPHAIIAVAAGRYEGGVILFDKGVQIWGRCPRLVEVVSVQSQVPGAIYFERANGAAVRGVAITGASGGIVFNSSTDTVADHVWIHDTANFGVAVAEYYAPASGSLSHVLIERAGNVAVAVGGAPVTVESSVLRDSVPSGIMDEFGRGIELQHGAFSGQAASLVVRSSLIERNQDIGVANFGSAATLESSIVRDTLPGPDGRYGEGVSLSAYPGTGETGSLTVRSSLVERNRGYGVAISGGDATIEASVVRDTLPTPDGTLGVGVSVDLDPEARAPGSVVIHASLVDRNQGLGVSACSTTASIESSIVRGPGAAALNFHGVAAWICPGLQEPAALTVRSSVVEQNGDIGIFISGAQAAIETSVVRDVYPNSEGRFGKGIHVVADEATGARGRLALTSTILERNVDDGVSIFGADAVIAGAIVRGSRTDSSGDNGHGIHVSADATTKARGTLELTSTLIEQSQSVGVLVAGADAVISASLIQGTRLNPSKILGRGIDLEADVATGEEGRLTLTSSVVQDNDVGGLVLFGGQTTIEGSVIRGNRSDGAAAETRGIIQQVDPDSGTRGSLTVQSSIIEQCQSHGVYVAGSDVTIEASAVRENAVGAATRDGAGIAVQSLPSRRARGTLALRYSLVDGNGVAGVFVDGADATIEASLVQSSQTTSDGTFGDGILVQAEPDGAANAAVRAVQVGDNARAGLIFVDSAGALSGVQATENRFGFVLQGASKVDLGRGNEFRRNTERDEIADGDLSVPKAAPPIP